MPKTLYIKTLSPTGVMSGASMRNFEYLHDGSNLYRLNIERIFGKIIEKYPDSFDKFGEWMEEMENKIKAAEKDNRLLSDLLKRTTILEFINTELHDASFRQEVQKLIKSGELSLYSMPCKSLEGTERKIPNQRGGKQEYDKRKAKKEIMLATKTGDNKFYLPGSSLKGSIRTALLGYVVRNADSNLIDNIKTDINKKLKKNVSENKLKEYFTDLVEYEVFCCGLEDERSREIKYNTANCNLMKLISVTDSEARPINDVGCIAVINLYKSSGEIQPQTPIIEAVNENMVFETRISFDMPFVLNAKRMLQSNHREFGKTIWGDIEKKFKRLFGVDIMDCTQENSAEMEDKILQHILNACKEHATRVKQRERQWADARAKRNDFDAKKMVEFYDKSTPTLKIGYAGGFPSTTIMMEMLEQPNLKQLMEQILNKFGIGKPRNAKPDFNLDINRFPTSRRFGSEIIATANIRPMGWLKLSFEPFNNNSGSGKIKIAEDNIEWLKEVKPGQKDVPAKVANISRKPMKVKICVQGHEEKEYDCSGINNPPPVGSLIYVEVKQMDKKTGKIQMLGFQKTI